MGKRLKSLITALGMALALTGCVSSGGGMPRAEVAELKSGPVRAPLLWTVEKGKDKSFLFGTVHVGVDAVRDLPPVVWQAFRASPCFVMEADQSEIEPRTMMAMARLPGEERLSKKISPAAWEKLQDRVGASLPQGLLDKSQPWFATLVFMRSGLPDIEPMDGVFQAEARAKGKRLEYLENWQEALGAFAKATDERDLEEAVLKEDEATAEMQKLVDAYLAGDETHVEKVIKEVDSAKPDGDAKLKILLTDRNDLWMPRLERSIKGGGCFVAVGAAHLVGPGSVKGQLEQAGYTVKRVHP